MPKPTKGPRLGGSPAHQRLILSNLATQLFEHGRITTTEAKARALRPLAEKLITKAKKGDLHNRREVLKTIRDKSVVHVLFTEIAPTFAERPGGYTRITKIGPRKGDNAPMAVIELVTEAYTAVGPEGEEGRPGAARSGRGPAPRSRGRRSRRPPPRRPLPRRPPPRRLPPSWPRRRRPRRASSPRRSPSPTRRLAAGEHRGGREGLSPRRTHHRPVRARSGGPVPFPLPRRAESF